MKKYNELRKKMKIIKDKVLTYFLCALFVIPYLVSCAVVWFSFGYVAYLHILSLGLQFYGKSWVMKVCALDVGFVVGAIAVAITTNLDIIFIVGKRSKNNEK